MAFLGYFFGIIGLAMVVIFTISFWRKVQRVRKYIKVPAEVVRIEEREWSGDIDRVGGTYRVPIISFEVQGVGKCEMGYNGENNLRFMQIGKKTTVAFPKDDLQKAIVWDFKHELSEFIKYFVGGIAIIIFSYFAIKAKF